MYTDYFGLKESPFSIAPNPRYLYMSERHREALAHLLFGINYEGGFVLLTGEVGTGKTTVCRCLLEQIPEDTEVALILNPCLTVVELLAAICDEFSIPRPAKESVKTLVDALNSFLLECHRRAKKAVLVLDEAQNFDCEVLEQIRLLTNLETNTRKLLQIVMIGQPELLDKLALPEMRQLDQRIIARYHLGPLSKRDVAIYIKHRLVVSGMKDELFDKRSLGRLYELSEGIPRVINVICDRAMLGAYSENTRKINHTILEQAANEVLGSRRNRRKKAERKRRKVFLFAAGAVALIIAAGWIFFPRLQVFLKPENGFGGREPQQIGSSGSDQPEAVVPPETEAQPVFSLPADTEEEKSKSNGMDEQEVPVGSGEQESKKAPVAKEGAWPVQVPPNASERRVYQELFRLWKVPYGIADDFPCQHARNNGLRCLFKQGSLADLITLNRPAVLSLITDQGQEFSATLTSFDGKVGELVCGDLRWRASAEDIARHWVGSNSFVAIWKPPAGYDDSIRKGYKGKVVEWLADRLSMLQGETVPQGKRIYDESFALQVKKFQSETGLVADGIAGVQTLIQLNNRTEPDFPRLHQD
jgi:general secretion pathway protein A